MKYLFMHNALASGYPTATAQLFELGNDFFFVYILHCCREPVRRLSQFREVCRPDGFARGGNVDAEGFAATGDGHGHIGFQKAGYLLAELADTDFDRRHKHLLVYAWWQPVANLLSRSKGESGRVNRNCKKTHAQEVIGTRPLRSREQ
jgi:hypothetical protein